MSLSISTTLLSTLHLQISQVSVACVCYATSHEINGFSLQFGQKWKLKGRELTGQVCCIIYRWSRIYHLARFN
ncbi:hypothetical protein QQG55_49305 [Brugia pahangi]